MDQQTLELDTTIIELKEKLRARPELKWSSGTPGQRRGWKPQLRLVKVIKAY